MKIFTLRPPALYAALGLLAFFPCFVFGQAYFDNDLLAQFGPWRIFLRDQLLSGHFPLWDPYLLGGQPFFADLQNMMLYPFNYLTLFFPVGFGLTLFFFLHLVGAAWGMHLWLQKLGVKESACRVGAVLFSFSGFFFLELIHPPVLAAFAWLPWLFLALECLTAEPKPKTAFFTGLAFAMLFLCGSFQVTVGALYAGAAYFLFRVLRPSKKDSSHPVLASWRLGGSLYLLFFLLWGTLPLLAQLIPTWEFSSLCDRRAPGQSYDQVNAHLSLHPSSLYQFLFPRLTLPKGQEMAEAVQSGPAGEAPFGGAWGYLGAWALFFAALALKKIREPLVAFLALFTLAGLLLSFGSFTPLHYLLCKFFPGFSLIRVPYRFLYLYVLPLSSLAAIGFEQWASRPVTPFKVPSGAFFFALLLSLTAFLRPSEDWREWVGLVLGFFGFLWAERSETSRKAGTLLLGAGLFLPLLLNGWGGYHPGPASNFDYAANSAPILQGQKEIAPFRSIFMTGDTGYPIEVNGKKYLLNYPQNDACVLGLKNFGGYDPLTLQDKQDLGTFPLKSIVLLGGIKGIWTQLPHGPLPGFDLKTFGPYSLYEYKGPLSLAYAPDLVEEGLSPSQVLARMQNPGWDIRQTALLSEQDPSLSISGDPADLECSLVKDGTDDQTYQVKLSETRLVVFTETNFPGWKAFIDDQAAPILTADHLLRSVVVPEGTHQVEFRFEPIWFKPIIWGLLLWFLLTAGWFLTDRKKTGLP